MNELSHWLVAQGNLITQHDPEDLSITNLTLIPAKRAKIEKKTSYAHEDNWDPNIQYFISFKTISWSENKEDISWYIKIRFIVIRDTVDVAVGVRVQLFVVT